MQLRASHRRQKLIRLIQAWENEQLFDPVPGRLRVTFQRGYGQGPKARRAGGERRGGTGPLGALPRFSVFVTVARSKPVPPIRSLGRLGCANLRARP